MNTQLSNALTATARRIFQTRRALFSSALMLIVTLLGGAAHGQQMSITDGKTPTGMAPGSPAGSYALSGFDNVNLFNGNLSFRLPLLKIGGRGSAGYTMTLPIEQKWIIKTGETAPSGITPMTPNPNWWEGIRPGYGPGVLQGRHGIHETGTRYEPYGINDGVSQILAEVYLMTLTRLTFTTADGTEFELRDQLTGGAPQPASWYPNTGDYDGFNRGKVFTTADGTAAVFISDADIKDRVARQLTQSQRLIYPSGYLLLKDGTRYRIDGGGVSWIKDRNGNKVTFGNGAFVTDSLGRTVNISPQTSSAPYDDITFNGYGAVRSVRINYDSLGARLRPNSGYTLQTLYHLFPLSSADSYTQFNPQRIASVVLPDGQRSYQFFYNPYGELARVELPTGGRLSTTGRAGPTRPTQSYFAT